jgi:hypothetical protein
MTYNSLVNQVMDYLIRTDIDTLNEVPNFIYQAEQRICRESKSIGLEVYVTGSFISNSPVLAKPARWRRSLTLNFGTGVGNNTVNQITLRSYEFVRNYWPNPTQTGQPKFYSDYGYDHLLIAPTPDQDYPFEYGYLQLPEPLSPSVQTNWLTNNAPDVLLYATLLEAVPFLQNDERIPVWQSMYDKGIASLNTQDDQRQLDRSSNRSAD